MRPSREADQLAVLRKRIRDSFAEEIAEREYNLESTKNLERLRDKILGAQWTGANDPGDDVVISFEANDHTWGR